jgi:hypothetical protein
MVRITAVGAEREANGPEQIAGDGDQWEQQARDQWSLDRQMMSHRR